MSTVLNITSNRLNVGDMDEFVINWLCNKDCILKDILEAKITKKTELQNILKEIFSDNGDKSQEMEEFLNKKKYAFETEDVGLLRQLEIIVRIKDELKAKEMKNEEEMRKNIETERIKIIRDIARRDAYIVNDNGEIEINEEAELWEGTVLHNYYYLGGDKIQKILEKQGYTIVKKVKEDNDEKIDNETIELYERINGLLKQFHQVIFQGPPGTGKTWEAKRLAAYILYIFENGGLDFITFFNNDFKNRQYSIMEEKNKGQTVEWGKGAWDIVQFHPSYNYEDFVRGIQVKTNDSNDVIYEIVDRILIKMASKAEELNQPQEPPVNNQPPFILIIDEINRANLAAVLGELIYALEYRGEKVRTPYGVKVDGDNESFLIAIPNNLYIIGTMNTADRSVGHIDYAVRRRFTFIPFLPEAHKLNAYYDKSGNDALKKLAIKLFEEVKELFESNLSKEFYKDDVQIGHTYFMAESKEELKNKFIFQIYPILREYYKDGILIKSGNDLSIIGITINKPLSINDLSDKIDALMGSL